MYFVKKITVIIAGVFYTEYNKKNKRTEVTIEICLVFIKYIDSV